MLSISEQIKEARRAAGLTQDDVANALGFSRPRRSPTTNPASASPTPTR